jgi:hypothetical protein
VKLVVAVALAACGGQESTRANATLGVAPIDAEVSAPEVDPAEEDLAADGEPLQASSASPVEEPEVPEVTPAPPSSPAAPEVWLRGSTHVHARPSGDSSTPIADVIRWYERNKYDFIVLTDHNQVSELDRDSDTTGSVAVRNPASGLVVLAGIELTHNPNGCLPRTEPRGRCRIHVNLLGATGRPGGKIEWADRTTKDRLAKYRAALVARRTIGGLAQLNHPTWFWGMSPELLASIAADGVQLVEIANTQFAKWNAGDRLHPSAEALWDAALGRGAALWAVASDDAHDYLPNRRGKYPAGGGWVVVRARRDPQAILDALAAGRFYASNGVELTRVEVEGGELVIDVGGAPATVEWVENGRVVARARGKSVRRAVPAKGYLRAVVARADGTKAWVQPVFAPP